MLALQVGRRTVTVTTILDAITSIRERAVAAIERVQATVASIFAVPAVATAVA